MTDLERDLFFQGFMIAGGVAVGWLIGRNQEMSDRTKGVLFVAVFVGAAAVFRGGSMIFGQESVIWNEGVNALGGLVLGFAAALVAPRK